MKKIDISIQRGRTWGSFDLYAGGGSGSNENKIELIPEHKFHVWDDSSLHACQNEDETNNGIPPKSWEKDCTPPKTNMEPENEPLEEEIPIRHHHF